jgi:multiple sugar transport system permease protein
MQAKQSGTASYQHTYQRRLRLMLLPYSLGILILFVIPAAIAFSLAFFHYDGLRPPQWAGLLNFRLVLTDELFALSIQNTLAFVLLPVPLRVAGAFLLARLLLRGGRFLNAFRAAVYLPSVIPGAAFALGWLWILNPLFGPLNLLLGAIGLDGPAWVVEPLWAKPAIILALLWAIGEGFLVSLAALHDLPAELEDAARVDGASAWGVLRHVTLPILAPILLLLALRDAILVFQESLTVTTFMTQGGPYYASFTLSQFIYEQAFGLLSFGTAGAALWVLYLLTGVVILLLYIIAHQWDVQTTEESLLL